MPSMTGNVLVGELADQMAEDGEELIVLLQRRRHVGEAKQHLAAAIFGEMQPDRRHAPGDRTADVEQIRDSARCARR